MRRITGSPRQIEAWQDVLLKSVMEKVRAFDRTIDRMSVRLLSREEFKRSSAGKAVYRIIDDLTVINLGNLSDMTGIESDVSPVQVALNIRYLLPDEEYDETDSRTFSHYRPILVYDEKEKNYSSKPISQEERQGDPIYGGQIQIIVGRFGYAPSGYTGIQSYQYIGLLEKFKREEILGTVSHELYHLVQHMSSRLQGGDLPLYRYGRAGDAPGIEKSSVESSRTEMNQHIRLEPDAYAMGAISQAKEQFRSFLIDRFNKAERDKDQKSMTSLADRGYRTKIAQVILWTSSPLTRRDFSGAGNSPDVTRYIATRIANSLERIVSSGDDLADSFVKRWREKGWRPSPTRQADSPLAFMRDIQHDVQRRLVSEKEIVDLLAKLDPIFLDALDYTQSQIESVTEGEGSREERYAYTREMQRYWFDIIAHALDSHEITSVAHDVLAVYRRDPNLEDFYDEDSIVGIIRNYVDSWFWGILHRVHEKGIMEARLDRVPPPSSIVHVNEDDEIVVKQGERY